VDFLRDVMPTTENVVKGIWDQLQPEINKLNCSLHCVKLQETENNYAEYYG
jgi:6-pyruvoyltetrahydropterin/6-carboxytetrahydropterin synthase